MDGKGGNAGPVLDAIGERDRAHLLESLLIPSAQIAQGFATTVLTLHNGDLVSGVVTKDQDGVVEITNIAGDVTKVPADRIKERRTGCAPEHSRCRQEPAQHARQWQQQQANYQAVSAA